MKKFAVLMVILSSFAFATTNDSEEEYKKMDKKYEEFKKENPDLQKK